MPISAPPADDASPSARMRVLLGAACMFATGCIVAGCRAIMLAHGRWEWPTFGFGILLMTLAVACARRRPSLATVVGAQGITAAFLAHDAFASVCGARSTLSILVTVLSLGALLLGRPLLSVGRTTTRFAPTAHRRALLFGVIASVAGATFFSTWALHHAHMGWLRGRADLVASSILFGSLALLQSTCAFAILRMRGIALVLGLVAAALSIVNAAAVVSPPSVACGLVALVALATPLVRRQEAQGAALRSRIDVDAAAMPSKATFELECEEEEYERLGRTA